jgi:hypothetical protein
MPPTRRFVLLANPARSRNVRIVRRCLISAAVMIGGLFLVDCDGNSGPPSTKYAEFACRDLRAAAFDSNNHPQVWLNGAKLQSALSYSEKAGGALASDARKFRSVQTLEKGKTTAYYVALAKVLTDCKIPVGVTANTSNTP